MSKDTAREFQLIRWRGVRAKLKTWSGDLCRITLAEFDIPKEAVDKLAQAGDLVQEAIDIVEKKQNGGA